MKEISIYHISDNHGTHFKTEKSDFLIHSGDHCNFGTEQEFLRLASNLKEVRDSHKYSLFIPGNHEKICQRDFSFCKNILLDQANTTILLNTILEVDGLIFGANSNTRIFNNWAFESSEETRKRFYDNFPKVDIMISHTPPKSLIYYGCEFLDNYLNEHKPEILLCGHAHEISKQNSYYIHNNGITKMYNSAKTYNMINFKYNVDRV